MIRRGPRLACCLPLLLLFTLLLPGCADKAPDPRQRTLCERLQARNRKCVDALVQQLRLRMGAQVPTDVKQRLAKPLAAEITKRDFVGLCREQLQAGDARSMANRAALDKCRAAADCTAYARCLLVQLRRFQGHP